MPETKTRPRKTVEDYLKLGAGVRAELIEGEIYLSPSPKRAHQRTVQNLFRALDSFVRSRDLGDIWIAPFDVHLPSGSARRIETSFAIGSAARPIS